MEALGINTYLLVQIISIIVIYLFLRAFAFKPITEALTARRERIAKGEENARLAEESLANAESQAETLMEEKRAEAQQVVSEATRRADEAASAIEAEAREEAQRILEAARSDAEAERNRLLADMRDQIAQLSMAAAQKIIGDGLDSNKQRALVDDFFTSLPSDAKGLGGQNVVVTTALPLSDAEQKKAQQEVGADEVAFKVDPDILGGAIVRVGDRVVDGSVRSKIGSLRGHLS